MRSVPLKILVFSMIRSLFMEKLLVWYCPGEKGKVVNTDPKLNALLLLMLGNDTLNVTSSILTPFSIQTQNLIKNTKNPSPMPYPFAYPFEFYPFSYLDEGRPKLITIFLNTPFHLQMCHFDPYFGGKKKKNFIWVINIGEDIPKWSFLL